MALHITPLRDDQVEPCLDIVMDAFDPSNLHQMFMPKGKTVANMKYMVDRDRIRLKTPQTGLHEFAIIDTNNGEIIGYVKWVLVDPDVVPPPEYEPPEPMPDCDMSALIDFFELAQKVRAETMGNKKYWHLKTLTTKPGRERRGVATLGLLWGLRMADEQGLECFLNSSPVAMQLYERHGFTVVRNTIIDCRKPGTPGNLYNHTQMIRKPKLLS